MAADDSTANNPAPSAGMLAGIMPDMGARTVPGFLTGGSGRLEASSGNATLGGAAAGGSDLVVTGGANVPPDEASSSGLFFFPTVQEAGGAVAHDFSPLDVAEVPAGAAGDPDAGYPGASVGGGLTITLPDETRITFGILPGQPPGV